MRGVAPVGDVRVGFVVRRRAAETPAPRGRRQGSRIFCARARRARWRLFSRSRGISPRGKRARFSPRRGDGGVRRAARWRATPRRNSNDSREYDASRTRVYDDSTSLFLRGETPRRSATTRRVARGSIARRAFPSSRRSRDVAFDRDGSYSRTDTPRPHCRTLSAETQRATRLRLREGGATYRLEPRDPKQVTVFDCLAAAVDVLERIDRRRESSRSDIE